MRVVRWFMGLAMALMLLCAAASWWIGVQLERQVRLAHAQWSEQSGGAVQLLSYQRGWLSSTATTEMRVGIAHDAPVLLWQHRIAHGPLPDWRSIGAVAAVSELVLRPAPEAVAAVAMRVTSHLGFDRAVRLGFSGQGGDLVNVYGANWSVAPLEGQLEWGPDGQGFAAQLDWGGMTWANAQGALVSIGAVTAEAAYQAAPGQVHVLDGQGALQVAHVELRNVLAHQLPQAQPVPSTWQLHSLEFDNRLQASAEFGSVSASLRAATIDLDGQAWGPAQWSMSLQQIHIATLERVWPKLSDWLQHLQPLSPPAGVALSLAERQVIQSDIAALFQHGLRLQLDRLMVQLAGGDLLLQGAVDAPSLTGTDLSFLPMSLAARINASLSVRAPESLLVDMRGAQAVAAWVAQGLLLRDGAELSTTLEYQRGLSRANGVAVDPASLAHWFQ